MPFALAALPAAAHADEDEASVFVHALSGAAMLDDPAVSGETRVTPLAGVAARLAYATHDAFAFEAELALSRTSLARFDDFMFEGYAGRMQRASVLGRIQTGVRFRSGLWNRPSLHVAVGALAHSARPSLLVMSGGNVEGPGEVMRWAPMASVGVGFERRLDSDWTVGASVTALSTLGLGVDSHSIEGSFHASYSWYPRWSSW
ncbi:hypothetical protein [Haliangium ochraceum]|uniref:hypothetical protein n=1 Tax=Haliangium ochraceum TaxID=80816 RepID=UPI001E3992CF|nr:hypothetical protein [Haliangium ochraceum]